MPRSMTGFGKAEFKNDRFELFAEVRSINSRFLDIGIKLPKSLDSYEYKLKQVVKEKVLRGKITITISYKDLTLNNHNLSLKTDTIDFYYTLLKQIKKDTKIRGKIKLEHLLSFKEIFEPEEAANEDTEIESRVTEVVMNALDNFNEMRTREAENISRDFFQHVEDIEQNLQEIIKKGKQNPKIELDKLKNRVKELITEYKIDQNRLETELAILADRVDISEECSRLKSHIDQFRNIYRTKDEVGKALTFMLQEMLREINTVGSKTTDVAIAYKVIKIKEDIEKIREQIQNIE